MARTRKGNYGGARQPHGTFENKGGAGSHPVEQVTRHGNYGGARQLYGDFDLKSSPQPFPSNSGVARPLDRARMLLNNPRSHAPRLFRRR